MNMKVPGCTAVAGRPESWMDDIAAEVVEALGQSFEPE